MPKPYSFIADRIAGQIVSGNLPVGTRLPPQRTFAYEEGIAPSTASRVYEELKRRGFVTGEVGRGTFVCNRFMPLDPAQQEPSQTNIDLEIVFRLGVEARDEIATSTTRFLKNGLSLSAVAPPSVVGNPQAIEILTELVTSSDFVVNPNSLMLAGSGKEAIAAALSALAPQGGRIAVESMTYPFVIATARLLGIELVPLPLDGEGIDPEALDHQARLGLDGVYLQPTLQSPLVLTMSQQRRKLIADILLRQNLIAIEDRVYSFLKPVKPIAAYAPDNVVQIDSLSKRLMPGMSLGLIIAPQKLHHAIARALRAGGWTAPALSVELGRHWVEEGLVASVEAAKRQEANAMYEIASASFVHHKFQGAPEALHGWLPLPNGWRGESFTAACAKLGIAVAPGQSFAVTPGAAPSGVRLAYSTPDIRTWKFATQELSHLLNYPPK